jgi:hypothetical protein
LEDDVRRVVEDALRREYARPRPRPDARDLDADDKIDNRLSRSDRQER